MSDHSMSDITKKPDISGSPEMPEAHDIMQSRGISETQVMPQSRGILKTPDILLTHGYFLQEDPAEKKIMKPYPPLGILYLSAWLKQKGFNVDVYDSTFSSFESFRNHVDERRPKAVGLYSNLMTRPVILRMIDYLKQGGTDIIVGGPETSHHYHGFIEAGAHYIVCGEGEETLAELLGFLESRETAKTAGNDDMIHTKFTGRDVNAPHGKRAGGTTEKSHDDILSRIRGLAFRDSSGRIIKTEPRPTWENLDTLPLPDREAIDLEKYISTWREHHGLGAVSLMTVRGCPYSCTWCSRAVFGETYRRRSPRLVADEVEMLIERYRPDMLWFADDVFTINHRWFFELRDEFQRRNIKIPFECTSRADRLNEKVVKALADMGCFRVWYGSESGSQRILDAMERGVTVEKVQEVTELTRKYGIESGWFVMFGYEGEDIPDIDATLDHLKKSNPDSYLTTIAYPIKGTPYYYDVEKHIHTRGSWHDRTERDVMLDNRPSRLFYTFVQAWIANEMRLHRHQTASAMRRIPWFLKAKTARIGMKMTGRGKYAKNGN